MGLSGRRRRPGAHGAAQLYRGLAGSKSAPARRAGRASQRPGRVLGHRTVRCQAAPRWAAGSPAVPCLTALPVLRLPCQWRQETPALGGGFWARRVGLPRLAGRRFLLFVVDPGQAAARTRSVWTHIPTSPGGHGGPEGLAQGPSLSCILSCQPFAPQPRHHPRSRRRPPRPLPLPRHPH